MTGITPATGAAHMALITHHGVGDQTGHHSHPHRGRGPDRGTQLLLPCSTPTHASRRCCAPNPAIAAMKQCIEDTTEHDTDWARTAAAAIQRPRRPRPGPLLDRLEEITETHHGAGLFFQGVPDIYFHLLPELRAPAG